MLASSTLVSGLTEVWGMTMMEVSLGCEALRKMHDVSEWQRRYAPRKPPPPRGSS